MAITEKYKAWLKRHQAKYYQTGGLEEKMEACQRLKEVSLKILDRREQEISVPVDRREGDKMERYKKWLEYVSQHS